MGFGGFMGVIMSAARATMWSLALFVMPHEPRPGA